MTHARSSEAAADLTRAWFQVVIDAGANPGAVNSRC